MNPFKAIGHALAGLGRLIGRAAVAAAGNGLTDEILQLALGRVRQLASAQIDNSEKREAVVSFLVREHVPESIARLAVEMGVSLLKSELGKLPGA